MPLLTNQHNCDGAKAVWPCQLHRDDENHASWTEGGVRSKDQNSYGSRKIRFSCQTASDRVMSWEPHHIFPSKVSTASANTVLCILDRKFEQQLAIPRGVLNHSQPRMNHAAASCSSFSIFSHRNLPAILRIASPIARAHEER